MSKQDREAERLVADQFLEQKSLEQDDDLGTSPWNSRRKSAKTFGESFLTGLALGSVVRNLFR